MSKWEILLNDAATDDLHRLDRSVQKRIRKFLDQRLAHLEDPRSVGEALKGTRFRDLWKYRVGDYRLMAIIEDLTIVIVVVKIGHRKEVYR